jgi:hypothetical protein
MVSLLRLGNDLFNPNTGAEEMNSAAKPEAINAKQAIADRAWKVKNKTAKQLVEKWLLIELISGKEAKKVDEAWI